jgi:hypothetical protein
MIFRVSHIKHWSWLYISVLLEGRLDLRGVIDVDAYYLMDLRGVIDVDVYYPLDLRGVIDVDVYPLIKQKYTANSNV